VSRLKTYKHSAQHNGGGSEQLALPEMLAQQTDRDQCRKRTFKIQQERSG
jgi:hypothetical protein